MNLANGNKNFRQHFANRDSCLDRRELIYAMQFARILSSKISYRKDAAQPRSRWPTSSAMTWHLLIVFIFIFLVGRCQICVNLNSARFCAAVWVRDLDSTKSTGSLQCFWDFQTRLSRLCRDTEKRRPQWIYFHWGLVIPLEPDPHLPLLMTACGALTTVFDRLPSHRWSSSFLSSNSCWALTAGCWAPSASAIAA